MVLSLRGGFIKAKQDKGGKNVSQSFKDSISDEPITKMKGILYLLAQ